MPRIFRRLGTGAAEAPRLNAASITSEAGTSDSVPVFEFGERWLTVTAKQPDCYTYSVGACTAGTVYGMCGKDVTQLIISEK